LLFNFALEYDIRNIQEYEVGLELNGIQQLLVYADDINLMVNNINSIEENKETHLGASRDVGLEINAEKTKYMIMSCHQNSGQNKNIRTTNELFKNVAIFKYLGMTLTKLNDIHDEIKKIKFGECLLSFSPKSFFFPCHIKKLKIKIYKTVILPVVLYGCRTWSLTLREEHRLWILRTEC
jgi:hypothetical protein